MPRRSNNFQRVHSEPLDVEYVEGTFKRNFGNLPRLIAPEGLRSQKVTMFVRGSNELLREMHERDSTSPKYRIAWLCAKVRTILLQVTKADYTGYSGLGTHIAINRVEKGHFNNRQIFEMLPKWIDLAQQLGDEHLVIEVEKCRDEVSRLLYWEDKDSVAGNLLSLAAKHGRNVADIPVESLVTKIQQKSRTSSTKAFHGYLNDVHTFADHLEKEMGRAQPERNGSATAELWDHPYSKQLRMAYLHDAVSNLRSSRRPTGKMDILCEYVRMMMAHAGERTGRDEFVQYLQQGDDGNLKLSVTNMSNIARDFSRNIPPSPAVVRSLFRSWVQAEVIPQSEADEFMKVWEKWQVEEQKTPEDIHTVGQDLYAGIVKNAQTAGMTDVFQMLKIAYKGFKKEGIEAIQLGQITRESTALYPAFCLRYETAEEIEHALQRLYEEHAARPSSKGKRYTHVHWLMSVHGITLEDIPADLRPNSIAIYGQEEEANEQAGPLVDFLKTLGKQKANEAIRKFNASLSPDTLREAGAYPVTKYTNILEKCGPGKAAGDPTVFYRLAGPEQQNVDFKGRGGQASSEQVFNLRRVMQLVKGVNADFSKNLLIDWYMRRSESGGYGPLGRALDVVMAEQADTGREFYDSVGSTDERLSENVCSRILTAAKQGKPFKTERNGSKEDRFAEFLHAWGIDTQSPRGIFLMILLQKENMHEALSDWCVQMRAQGREDLIGGLLQFKERLLTKQEPTLEERLAKKKQLLEKAANGEIGSVFSGSNDAMIQALKSVPGATAEDLQTWVPPFDDVVAPHDEIETTAEQTVVDEVSVQTIETVENTSKPLPAGGESKLERELLELMGNPRIDVNSENFETWYASMMHLYGSIFPEEKYPDASKFICSSAEEFRAALNSASELHRELAIEIADILAVQQRTGDGFNDKKPYIHQEAYLFAIMCSIARCMEQGLGILLDASAGSGKTLIQGVVAAAFRNGQRRGVIDPTLKIIFLMAKEAFENQQLMDEEARHAVVFSTNPDDIAARELQDHYEFAVQEIQRITGASADSLFPNLSAFKSLYEHIPAEESDAEETLRSTLTDERWSTDEGLMRLLKQLSLLLSRKATIVIAPDHVSWQFLHITRPSSAFVIEHAMRTGDLTFGLGEDTRLYTRSEERDFKKVSPEEWDAMCLSHLIVIQSDFQRQYGELLRGGLFLLDEAKNYTSSFFEQLARAGGVEHFVGMAATARDQGPKKTEGLGRFEVMLPHFLEEDAIDGSDRISQPATMVVFPGKEEVHYSCGSYEHAEQLVVEYGKMLELSLQKDRGRKTLGEGLHIITVPREMVPYVTTRLQQEYGEKTGIDFVSYMANRLVDGSAKAPRVNRMQALMCDHGFQKRCFVGTMVDFLDSLDPREATGVIMGMHERHNDGQSTRRYYGRGNHSRVPGWLFAQQRSAAGETFNNTVFKTYPPATVRNPVPEGYDDWTVVDGQTMWGKKMVEEDERAITEGNYVTRTLITGKKTTDDMPVPTAEGEIPQNTLEVEIAAGHTSPEWIAQKAREVRARMGLSY